MQILSDNHSVSLISFESPPISKNWAKESLPPVMLSATLGYSMPTQLKSSKDAYNASNNMPLSSCNQVLGFIWLDVPKLHACLNHASVMLEALPPSKCLGTDTVCKHVQGHSHQSCAIMVNCNLLCVIRIGLP